MFRQVIFGVLLHLLRFDLSNIFMPTSSPSISIPDPVQYNLPIYRRQFMISSFNLTLESTCQSGLFILFSRIIIASILFFPTRQLLAVWWHSKHLHRYSLISVISKAFSQPIFLFRYISISEIVYIYTSFPDISISPLPSSPKNFVLSYYYWSSLSIKSNCFFILYLFNLQPFGAATTCQLRLYLHLSS
jgi:hypothetical protein